MNKRILNTNNCTFICPALQGTITNTQKNHKFKDGTGITLTAQTSLSGNGICSILTSAAGGIPTSCTLKMSKNWISGIEMQKKINGIPILNEDAKMFCPVGSNISVLKPLPPIIDLIVGLTIDNGLIDSEPDTNTEKSESAEKSEESYNELSESSEYNSDEKQQSEDWNDSKQINYESSKEESICSYDSCNKAENCPYMQEKSTISTEGAAAKLRKNSSSKEKNYDERSERIMEENRISWNNQAHHLISIKAAYCQYPELVKLGNYFGYSINCEENCYFLPCWESGDGYGKKTSHFKKAQAYEVMKASGLQWHVGQHSYRIELSENVLNKYPELRTMDCYNDKINKDVKEILSACKQRFDNICIAENYEEHMNWFLKQMNDLSERVEEYLDLFGGIPRDSFPYFVSLESLKYAYEIPRSGKVISIYKTKTQWVLKRYQYTNYLKDTDIQLNILETKVLTIAENHRDETIRSLILFCENVTCFLVIDETMTFKMPFQYKVKYQHIKDEESSKVKSHFSAMLAEQADNGEDEYISPKAMVVQRLKECGIY